MTRKILIDEIVRFGSLYGLFDKKIRIYEIRNTIETQLANVDFVESLINTIIRKTKSHKNVDTEKLKELLLALEKIRLNLEYKK